MASLAFVVAVVHVLTLVAASSSPLHFPTSSSPRRGPSSARRQAGLTSDAPSHQSVDRVRGETPLFFPTSGGSTPRRVRRGDIHSSLPLSSPSLARRGAPSGAHGESLFPDPSSPHTEPSTPGFGHEPSGPSFSVAEGDAIGAPLTDDDGGMVKFIWGTTISLHEAMNDFRSFLRGFKVKYRAAYNAANTKAIVDAGGVAPPSIPLYDGLTASQGEELLYERYLRQLRETAQQNLNLDAINLLAYPPTKKLYQQLLNYPQEVVPIMDQVLRDVMIEMAEEEFEAVQGRFADGEVGELEVSLAENEVSDVEGRIFKVRPYGGERTVNMRDLNPGGKSLNNPVLQEEGTNRRHRQARQRQRTRHSCHARHSRHGHCLLPLFGLPAHCPSRD